MALHLVLTPDRLQRHRIRSFNHTHTHTHTHTIDVYCMKMIGVYCIKMIVVHHIHFPYHIDFPASRVSSVSWSLVSVTSTQCRRKGAPWFWTGTLPQASWRPTWPHCSPSGPGCCSSLPVLTPTSSTQWLTTRSVSVNPLFSFFLLWTHSASPPGQCPSIRSFLFTLPAVNTQWLATRSVSVSPLFSLHCSCCEHTGSPPGQCLSILSFLFTLPTFNTHLVHLWVSIR